MARILAVVSAVVMFTGCSMIPGMGGGAGAWKPTECMNNQYAGDLGDAKVGRQVVYVTEAGGAKTTQTVKIVGNEGTETLIEQWMDTGSMAYGYLFAVGADKKIARAWAAAKDDKEWTKIEVKEPPKPGAAPEGPKPVVKESDEKKEVPAGTFASHKMDVTVKYDGKDINSLMWYSKDVPKLWMSGEHGGVVAMEAAGSKTVLQSKSEDAKPTIELPKKS